ncbi:MAG: bifunctional phosphoribosyl-AMP cyclohydrolase/phosphoribosyl-ATP diphosphatase HisIE [Thermaceae bacterium]|nr:bifunctional phosphoribosyl-AMP cyclohydrolase/phosphoribosyl-ATP diphosphatase HisIE [Thermaceae bacterium]
MNLSDVKFDSNGLVPVIVQDAASGQVLTLAYANLEALEQTLYTRKSTFWSRSRRELWVKGATSGNTQEVLEVVLDCDQDAVLYKVIPNGPACHTGAESCFHNPLIESSTTPSPSRGREPRGGGEASKHPPLGEVLEKVYRTIESRIQELPEGSYVAKMHQAGLDRILKKIGEEAGEVIIAAKNENPEELRWEASDLLFHLLFTLAERGLSPDDLAKALWERHKP